MTMLEAPHSSPLDASTHEFISTFMSHVATIASHSRDRTAIIARVKTLLLNALEAGDDDSMGPWCMLHQTVAAIVETAQDAHDTRSARAYLRSFVQENADLAVCTWPKSVPAANERSAAARRKYRLATPVALALALVAALVVSVGSEQAMATPVFAQAYGVSCTACHTQMPMLNAFGRYIQRTGYAALNPKTLQHAVPVFLFDVGTGYTHQSGDPASDHVTGPFHSTLLQANGALSPDVTYKIEQFMLVGGQAGFLEQGWLAYHNLFNHYGHLFVGKLPSISLDEYGAAVLAEVNDAGQGRLPNIDVGVHNYALDYVVGRWGTKFNYVRGKTLLQAAYLGNATGAGSFGDAYDYSRGADRSFQWRVAYADPAKPYEVGVFGETGALGFSGSALLPGLHVDNYNVVAPYINKDPRPGSPGFRFEYATATDSNPGYLSPPVASDPIRPVGSTASSWMIGSAYQMVLHDHGMVNLTYYHTNQALEENDFTGLVQPTGPQTGGGPGFSYAINPYSRFYTSIYLAQNQRPAFSVVMWFTPPLWSRLK